MKKSLRVNGGFRIAALVICVVAAYFSYRFEKTNDWMVYRNEMYGFEFRYPKYETLNIGSCVSCLLSVHAADFWVAISDKNIIPSDANKMPPTLVNWHLAETYGYSAVGGTHEYILLNNNGVYYILRGWHSETANREILNTFRFTR